MQFAILGFALFSLELRRSQARLSCQMLAQHTDESVQLLAGMFAREGEAKITSRGATRVSNERRENSGPQELPLQLRDLLRALRENGNDWTRSFNGREVRIAQCLSNINEVSHQTFSQAPIILQKLDALQGCIGQRQRQRGAAYENLASIEDFLPQISGSENRAAVRAKGFAQRQRLDNSAARHTCMFQRTLARATEHTRTMRIVHQHPGVFGQPAQVLGQRRNRAVARKESLD